ncbi:MAG: molybdopterin cofactor-binding domain-containing protein [Woeseiaceae bacterium]|nr:molybdopterin cofactor-binding domain-containing protein [Woeseiaceae bacterium]
MAVRAREIEGRLSRRTFIAGSAGATVVMGLGVVLPGCSSEQAAEDMAAGDASRSFAPTVWYEIDGEGGILVNIAKAEMGQHVGTALARVVADELGADWDRVSIKYVDSDPKWGYMVTGGSWSVHTTFRMLSQAGAAGRMVLRDAGAKLLDVAPGQVTVSGSKVAAGERSISFAEIVRRGEIGRSFTQEELDALPMKPANERTLIGKPATAKDIPAKATGDAVFGIDVERPGMVFAHPLLPPTRYGSTIRAIDDSAAKEIPGYQQTLQLDDPSEVLQGWAVVIADDYPSAMRAAAAVKVDYAPGPTADVSEADLIAEGEKLAADRASGVLVVDDGDVAAAREAAASTLNSVYRTHTALHFTLEPANALAEFVDGHCHIHSGNQWQSLILPTLAKALDMAETDITLHQYYLGGGYGRRLWGDPMIPAALAAKALGKPVKLVFQRPEDSRFDCVRSASVQQFDASFDADGGLTGIEHAAAAGWPTLTLAPGFLADGLNGSGKYDTFSISGGDHWYTLPNHRVRAINNTLAQRTFLPGWLRAVGPGWVGWGVESFMDEIAHEMGVDPIEFRLGLLDATGKNAGTAPNSVGGAARLAAVLEDVRDRAPWGQALPEGEGLGVAVCHGQERAMPTWIATIAHVAVNPDSKAVEVKKIWQTIDCGTVVHPDGAMAQAEGAILWGLSLALHEGTAFEKGQVAARNLDRYTPLRMADVPELDIRFMDNTEFPQGMGEPPLISVPPAVGNAIFAATGTRVHDLPIKL